MLIKLGACVCLEIRMREAVTTIRMIIVPLNGWNVADIWEQYRESIFFSGRN
jgi:hypothetical protein